MTMTSPPPTATPIRREITLDAPPRKVSLRAQASTLAGGGALAGFCWLWLLVSAMAWTFVAQSELVTLAEFALGRVVVDGEVLGVAETSAEENEQAVLATAYVYDYQGQRYEGTSYGLDAPHGPGERVDVEVVSYRPERSRIRGRRARMFGLVGGLALLFPFIGLVLAVRVVRRGLRERRLLRCGLVGHGKLSGKRATGVTVNDAPEYELTFAFEAAPPAPEAESAYRQPTPAARAYHATVKTVDPSRLTDEAEEALLYDPADPSVAVMIDGLPPGLLLAGDVGGGGLKGPLMAAAAVVVNVVVILLAI